MDRAATTALLFANAFLAAAILFSGWGYYQAMVVFWLEVGIAGFYNVGRMYVAAMFGSPFGRWIGFEDKFSAFLFVSLAVGFFLVKFGGFVLGVGFMVFLLPGFLAEEGADDGAVVMQALRASLPVIALCTAVLFVSHGISFLRNFIGRREYESMSVIHLLFSPYLRMLYLFAILVVALVAAALQPLVSPSTGFAFALVTLKCGGDLLSHRWLHRSLAKRAPRAEAPAGAAPAAA